MNPVNKKIIAGFAVLISAGIAFSLLIRAGIFPVAFVGSSPILSKDANALYSAATRYYANMIQASGGQAEEIDNAAARREMRRAALDKLIEETIIKNELEKRIGNDLNILVRKKINEAEKNSEDLNKAVALLYGIGMSDFESLFLVPQAEYEILDGRLTLEGEKIDDWLAEARKTAGITILAQEFKWNGNAVESAN